MNSNIELGCIGRITLNVLRRRLQLRVIFVRVWIEKLCTSLYFLHLYHSVFACTTVHTYLMALVYIKPDFCPPSCNFLFVYIVQIVIYFAK